MSGFRYFSPIIGGEVINQRIADTSMTGPTGSRGYCGECGPTGPTGPYSPLIVSRNEYGSTGLGIGGYGTSFLSMLDVQGAINTTNCYKINNYEVLKFGCGTDGCGSIFMGINAGNSQAEGSCNIAIGLSTLNQNLVSGQNTSIGAFSQENFESTNPQGNNTSYGYSAMRGNIGATGINNASFGSNSAVRITRGCNNSALGVGAIQYITTGNDNTILGYRASELLTTANYNTSIGSMSNVNNNSRCVTVGYNTVVGAGGPTGSGGIALGMNATVSSTGTNGGIAIGDGATVENSGGIALGHGSITSNGMLSVGSADQNVGIIQTGVSDPTFTTRWPIIINGTTYYIYLTPA